VHHDLELHDDRDGDEDRERLDPIEAQIQDGLFDVGQQVLSTPVLETRTPRPLGPGRSVPVSRSG